jgi:small basic protein (TIGR04137 family)
LFARRRRRAAFAESASHPYKVGCENHAKTWNESMSLDKSLRKKAGLGRSRNVLKRGERITALKEQERWKDGMEPFNLPKVRIMRMIAKKAKKAKTEEGAEAAATPAAAGGKAAPAAAGKAAPAAAGKAAPAAKPAAKK